MSVYASSRARTEVMDWWTVVDNLFEEMLPVIGNEPAAREAADTTLQGNIDTEASTRASADTTLQGNIDSEASTRASADTTLQGNIDSEASTRVSADATLQGNIDSEAGARAAADTALQTQITAVKGTADAAGAAIEILNGTGAGSVSKAVADGIAGVIAEAPESLDTLKEISDWISTHESDAAAMNSAIHANRDNVAPVFSESVSYSAGQYVTYNEVLYRCTTARSAGAWAAADFTQTVVGAELQNRQKKTLDTALSVDGVQETTVEGALSAINTLAAANKAAIAEIVADASVTLLSSVYPVGSLYWTSSNENPSVTFGFGTWTQIKDRFVWAKGDSDPVNATGGAKTVTLTVANLPSHNHTFTGTPVTSDSSGVNHTHGMNHHHYTSGTTDPAGVNHTHSGTTGGMSDNSTGWFSLANNKEVIQNNGVWDTNYGNYTNVASGNVSVSLRTATKAQSPSDVVASGGMPTYTINVAHTHSFTTGGASSYSHQHAYGAWSGDSYTTANNSTVRSNTDGASQYLHTHSVTASGTIGNTGSGTAINIMPPYVVKYCWERTA